MRPQVVLRALAAKPLGFARGRERRRALRRAAPERLRPVAWAAAAAQYWQATLF
jgi:hypothetical protein